MVCCTSRRTRCRSAPQRGICCRPRQRGGSGSAGSEDRRWRGPRAHVQQGGQLSRDTVRGAAGGELRWRPPAPAAPWHGVRNAITDPPGCPQNEGGLLPGVGSSTEDCLYLSVYRPARSNTQTRLPVLFWMHGGGFGSGAGWLYDGSTVAQRNDVVVVTINYRLGALGYLTSPALDAEQGNSGQLRVLGPDRRAEVGAPQHHRVRR